MQPRTALVLALLLLPATLRGAGAQPYDLRGPAPKTGTIIQSRTELRNPDGTLTVEGNGSVTRARASGESASTTETEIVETAGKTASRVRYRVAEDWQKRSIDFDGAAPQITLEDSPLVGETLLIERRDGNWVKTLLGHEPSEEQRKRLREPYADGDEIYPAKPVAVGATWQVEGAKLAAIFGFADALSVEGKAHFTLDEVAAEAGDRLALLSYRLELRVKQLDDNQVPADFSLGGSGSIKRSLTAWIDVSNRFSGQQLSTFTVTQDGSTSKVTSAGPVEITETKRLITDSTRAVISRRAQTERKKEWPSPSAKGTAPKLGGSCQGTALPCSKRSPFNCSLSSGCFSSGTCGGFPTQTCAGKPQFSCTSTPGCFWQSWSKTCGGFLSCAGKNSFTCSSTPGCFWQGSCAGNARPCSALSREDCARQPGCELR